MTFLLLKTLHVLTAMVAVGANATYGIWMARAGGHPEELAFALRGIRWIDNHVANPAYVLLLPTGLALAHAAHVPPGTPWLVAALVLYAMLAAVGLLGYTPTLRRQIAALDSEGIDSPRYRRLARRATVLGASLGVLALAIVTLMVWHGA
jgi:uncharacterized membrane protein